MKEVQATFPTLDPLHTYTTPYMLYAHDRFIELFSLLDDPGAIKKSRRRKRKMTYCDAICTDSKELILSHFLKMQRKLKVGMVNDLLVEMFFTFG